MDNDSSRGASNKNSSSTVSGENNMQFPNSRGRSSTNACKRTSFAKRVLSSATENGKLPHDFSTKKSPQLKNVTKKINQAGSSRLKVANSNASKKQTPKKGPIVRQLNSDLIFIKNRIHSNRKLIARGCTSLTSITAIQNTLPADSVKSSFQLTPSHKVDSSIKFIPRDRRNRPNYMDQFDLLRNGILFNEWGKKTWTTAKKEKTQTAPKLPAASKPFPLRKRTFSYGILSMAKSKETPSKEENHNTIRVKNGGEDAAPGLESDENDIYYSSEETDDDGAFKDCCLEKNGDEFPEKGQEQMNNLPSTANKAYSGSVLVINEPIHVTFIDEHTEQRKEMLIYADDYLKNKMKENSKVKKNEILKNLVQHSQAYAGKVLRILLDAKKIISKTSDGKPSTAKPIPTSNSAKPKYNTEKIAKREPIDKTKLRKTSSTPCFTSTAPNKAPNQIVRRERTPFMQTVPNQQQLPTVSHSFDEKWHCSAYKGSTERVGHRLAKLIELKTARNSPNASSHGKDKASTIARKRVNAEEIIASNFRHFFHFYSKLGGRLKSGVVISKMNSNFWLRRCGIISDEESQGIAEECFSVVARRKVVLNISDYIQYLTAIARKRHMILSDIIHQLMNVKPQIPTNSQMDREFPSWLSAHEMERLKNRKSIQERKWSQSD